MFAALLISALTAAFTYRFRPTHSGLVTDLDQTLIAARLLWAHRNPYVLIGPHAPYAWGWKWYYPLPAALLVMPIAWLSLPIANALFTGASGGLLAYGVTRESWHHLPLFCGAAYFYAAWTVQWSPLLTAAVLMPAIGGVFAAKPTIGSALFLARPNRNAMVGGVLLLALSIAIMPSWLREWIESIRSAEHVRPPILATPIGPIVLLALIRWRRADARLLLLLACTPQTIAAFEMLPLALIPATFREAVILATTTTIAYLAAIGTGGHATLAAQVHDTAYLYVLGCYTPTLVMVLRRPNAGALPRWIVH